MNRGFFITGTDTGVGKTVIAAAIIRALRSHGIHACGMKPVETGCRTLDNILYPSDGMFLKKVAGMEEAVCDVTPFCFETPLAPLASSEIAGRAIDIPIIIERFNGLLKKYAAVVVEGIGGILVPIKKDYFVIDLVKELNLPLIVVARPSLGTINHTLLTVRCALNEGIKVAGVIINFNRPPDGALAEKTNPHILQRLSPVPIIGTFPYLDNLEDETIKEKALKHLDVGALLSSMS